MFARTPRLTLRPRWPEDAAALTEAVSHESVATNLARLPWPYRRDHAEAWLAAPRPAPDATFVILAHDRAYPRLIGVMSIAPEGDRPALGYWLTPAAWGYGYATEAGRAVLGVARHALGLAHLTSSYFIDNPASGRVLEKLGFREVARGSRFCLARGRDVPCVEVERTLAGKRDAALCLTA